MKTNVKKIVMPMAVITVAITGAFASNFSKQNKSALVDRVGYIKSGSTCTPTQTICSTDFNLQMCTDGINPILYDWNGTNCENHLFHKVIVP